ncbi:MAG TPA: class I SAM-dependent methyltransferase [Solirubrobacterales bacterium]|nr:class I SAM-dependent methyltransferase [Solirubrobacterales bacterium]
MTRHEDQAEIWNGAMGRTWADMARITDRLFEPLAAPLVEVAGDGATAALDVGCGAGFTTLAVARALGRDARTVGADISEPLLLAARERAMAAGEPIEFILGDAGAVEFAAASFDLIVSRLGVMFFADPVAAFANLRRAATAGGRLRFVAWRGPEENPLMTLTARATADILDLPDRVANAPGPYGLADPERTRGILAEAGWDSIKVRPFDPVCALPAADLMTFFTRIGPLRAALEEADEARRAAALEAVRAAAEPFVEGDRARFDAALWIVDARAA